MNAKIAVIGMGQGGMVAAIKLAAMGAAVTVYERREEGEVSYPWRDDIRMDIFEKGLCLPSDNKMTPDQQDRIIEVIKACFE